MWAIITLSYNSKLKSWREASAEKWIQQQNPNPVQVSLFSDKNH